MGIGQESKLGDNGRSDEKEVDDLRIHELYSRIPSPNNPEAGDWTPMSVGDQEAHSRILHRDDIKGVKTTLYKYQLVRGESRII